MTTDHAWTCSRCGTIGAGGQNFCRSCGSPRGPKRPAPITEQVPVISPHMSAPRAVSRARLVLVAALFVVVGALIALVFDDLRGDEPTDPGQPSPTTVAVTSTT